MIIHTLKFSFLHIFLLNNNKNWEVIMDHKDDHLDSLRYVFLTQEQYDSIYKENKESENKENKNNEEETTNE
jgi:hypothetical protein